MNKKALTTVQNYYQEDEDYFNLISSDDFWGDDFATLFFSYEQPSSTFPLFANETTSSIQFSSLNESVFSQFSEEIVLSLNNTLSFSQKDALLCLNSIEECCELIQTNDPDRGLNLGGSDTLSAFITTNFVEGLHEVDSIFNYINLRVLLELEGWFTQFDQGASILENIVDIAAIISYIDSKSFSDEIANIVSKPVKASIYIKEPGQQEHKHQIGFGIITSTLATLCRLARRSKWVLLNSTKSSLTDIPFCQLEKIIRRSFIQNNTVAIFKFDLLRIIVSGYGC